MSKQTIKVYTENNYFQHIEVVKRNREKRNKYKEFFVEGVRPINRAIENGWKFVSVAHSMDKPLSAWANEVIQKTKVETIFQMSQNLMDKLSDKTESSELIAILEIPNKTLSEIKIKEDLLVVVFDRPSSPGNLGTIIRSCDSFKADGLIITGHSVDLYDPETIRASVGSFFSTPVIKLDSHIDLLEWFDDIRGKVNGFQIVGSSVKTDELITNHEFTKPTAFILGNETEGLSKNYRGICDSIVKIPIYGSASSLNVACAASIALYEIDRQRSLIVK